MQERSTDICFLTEVWEKKENKKHQFKLEEMLEMRGVKYISTPRPGAQRGGGAAIAVRAENFNISKLNIPIPKSVEAVWGLLKPKVVTGKITVIIVCCFYSPPRSKKNAVLIEHITLTLQSQLNTHPNAGIIISGDRNSMDIATLLSIDSTLRQTVDRSTRGHRILDVILSNLHCLYNVPEIVDPIVPDQPGKGVPSDHNGVIATPHTNSTQPPKNNKVKRKIRPIPESLLLDFGQKLQKTDFEQVYHQKCSSKMVSEFQNSLTKLIEETFPQKTVTISSGDVPWFNEKLRSLKRSRMREYNCKGRSEKYLKLQKLFDDKFEIKYKQKLELEVTEGKRGSTYGALKKLGLRPGEDTQSGFQLPEHIKNNLSSAQSAEVIADFFSSVSQEYSPLKITSLPQNVQSFLSRRPKNEIIPTLSDYQVYKKIIRSKKPNSSVPGDLPKKIVQQFPAELAVPVSKIFNYITTTAVYPAQWKTEYQIPLPKVQQPESEDELRNIAKTSYLSKVYESVLADWLIPIIQPFLDPGQCGLKGFSITHYLIKLLHFVHSTWDKRQPHAVLAGCIDLSKAFNRVDHCLVIQDLYDMHTPSWLLNIIFSYLSDRSMFMTYNGEQSSRKALPGGGPQGAYLGGLIFIIKYNGAFMRPPIPRDTLGPITKSKCEKVKYVDDGTVATSVNLKNCLVNDPISRPKPLNFHERTGHILPPQNNLLQFYLDDTEKFTIDNNMKINHKKTRIILFNKSRIFDFPPEVYFSDQQNLVVINDMKLLGVIITDNLRWQQNTDFICQKARQKLWTLRRMKRMKMNSSHIWDVYTKEVRSHLELAVPVWHSGLTKHQSAQIERIQKSALRIILDDHYTTYEEVCSLYSVEQLEKRRLKLCLNFAKKDIKRDKSMFQKPTTTNTRSKPTLVKEFTCRTKRFEKSSLPYLSKLLNKCD